MSTDPHPGDDVVTALEILRSPPDGTPPDGELAIILAEIQARTDLDNAKCAASLLTTGGLRELRAWIDSQLRAW